MIVSDWEGHFLPAARCLSFGRYTARADEDILRGQMKIAAM